jgi:hypothetical protein
VTEPIVTGPIVTEPIVTEPQMTKTADPIESTSTDGASTDGASTAGAVDAHLQRVRHDLRNRMASVSNALYFVRRRAEQGRLAGDERVNEMLTLMATELAAAVALVDLVRTKPDDTLEDGTGATGEDGR